MFFDDFFGDDFGDFFDDLEVADFAFVGGAIGLIEEELEEKKRIEREMEGLDPVDEKEDEELDP